MDNKNNSNQKTTTLEEKITLLLASTFMILGGIGLLVSLPQQCSTQSKDKKEPIKIKSQQKTLKKSNFAKTIE